MWHTESLVDAADNSSNSLTPKGHTEDESSESSSVEETRISVVKNVEVQLTNVTTSHVPQWTESDGDKTFSTKKKGSFYFLYDSNSASCSSANLVSSLVLLLHFLFRIC